MALTKEEAEAQAAEALEYPTRMGSVLREAHQEGIVGMQKTNSYRANGVRILYNHTMLSTHIYVEPSRDATVVSYVEVYAKDHFLFHGPWEEYVKAVLVKLVTEMDKKRNERDLEKEKTADDLRGYWTERLREFENE